MIKLTHIGGSFIISVEKKRCRTQVEYQDYDRRGQIDNEIVKYSGADTCGKDAMEAVKLARDWIGTN